MGTACRFSDACRGQLKVIVAVVALGAGAGAAGCGGGGEQSAGADGHAGAKDGAATIAFLVPSSTGQPRWMKQDAPFFTAGIKKFAPDAKVQVFNANDDAAKQQSQAEAALTNGADVLVVVPVDGVAAGAIVTTAKRENVPVIAYARPIEDAPFDYFVTADVATMGQLQAQWILDNTTNGDKIAVVGGATDDVNAHIIHDAYSGLLKSGARKIVSDTFTPQWDPVKAQRQVEQVLTKESDDLDGVLVSNDGMAGGVVAALREQGLAGKVPVTGLDANIDALQRVLGGTQGMTVLIPIREQAEKAAEVAAALVRGEKPSPGLFDKEPFKNGDVEIPRVLVDVLTITKDNVDRVIEDGGVTKQEVCAEVKAGVGPC